MEIISTFLKRFFCAAPKKVSRFVWTTAVSFVLFGFFEKKRGDKEAVFGSAGGRAFSQNSNVEMQNP
jgi:hypothetical protein